MFPGGMPNLNNVSTDQMKQSANQLNSMTDEQIQAQIDMMKGFNPMFANMTVAQMRAMGNTMGGMNEQQLRAQREQAARMQSSGNFPGFGAQNSPNPQSASPPSEDVPQEAKEDLNRAK